MVIENNQNMSGPGWKEGLQLFVEISTWIAGPIILALVAGKALDSHFGTKPTIVLIFAAVAFLTTSYGIVHTTRNYAKKLKEKLPPKQK